MTGLCLAAPLVDLMPSLAAAAERALPDATALGAEIAAGRVTAIAATEAALGRVAALNCTVGAVVTLAPERALASAAQVRPGASPFAGVPILIKDIVDVRGIPTRRGSRGTPQSPASTQSPLIDAIEAAGFVIIGKSQTPEFAASPTTEPLLGPITRNPASLGHIVGGSSGGAAAAVASGMVAIAHGTDGGGSLRMPASCCGVFALKPSRGRMIDPGGPKPRIELSVPGAISRTVRDSAAFLSLFERRDATASLPPVGMVAGPGQRRLRIGLNLKTLRGGDPDPEVAEAVLAVAERCRALGHEVRPFAWSFDGPGLAAALDPSMGLAELAAGMMRQKGVPLADLELEPLHVRMAEAGRAMKPEQMASAMARYGEVQKAYPLAFAAHDVLLTPTLAQVPPLLGQLDNPDRPLRDIVEGYLALSPYTTIQNIAGAPAMSLPLGISASGLPIGVHFAGPIGGERTLLELAYELEAEMTWRPGLERGMLRVDATAPQLAKCFREALGNGADPVRFARWLGAMWDDEVTVSSRPALGLEGRVAGKVLAERQIAVAHALAKLPGFRADKLTMRARGTAVEVHGEVSAAPPGGAVPRRRFVQRYDLVKGRIARVETRMDLETVKVLGVALQTPVA